jgi:hypothetical protein
MSPRVRRLGFGATLATGLSLIALSFGGMASLDGDLQAAAEQTPGIERVEIVDTTTKHDRDCDRRRQPRETTTSDREI